MLSLILIGTPIKFIFSYLGTCVCGECSCHDVDPTGDWGDIHGDTCECDERDCRAVYDRYSDDFCSGKVLLSPVFMKRFTFSSCRIILILTYIETLLFLRLSVLCSASLSDAHILSRS